MEQAKYEGQTAYHENAGQKALRPYNCLVSPKLWMDVKRAFIVTVKLNWIVSMQEP